VLPLNHFQRDAQVAENWHKKDCKARIQFSALGVARRDQIECSRRFTPTPSVYEKLADTLVEGMMHAVQNVTIALLDGMEKSRQH
jgi:hypothetical protein